MNETISMPVRCDFPLLLARVNVERAKHKQPVLSLRRLADESGVSLSVLTSLNTGKSSRIDFETIDKLLSYFSTYFSVSTADLLVWESSPKPGQM